MKMLFVGAVFISLLFFVSCQKEIDWGLGGIISPNLLLVKIKSKTGTDTTQIDYTYDVNKKLIREKTAGISGGTNLDNDLLITRNSSGIITKTKQIAATLIAAGIDSVVTLYYYDATTSKYTYSVFQLTITGFTVTDSAVYGYDPAGRISGDSHYLQVLGLPIPLPPTLSAKDYYIYSASGSNMDSVKQDAATTPGGPLSPVTSEGFTFDTKTNPLVILNEAVLLGRTSLYNANNATKSSLTDLTTPANDFSMDIVYKYNSVNKPDSTTGTRTPGGAVTATKYYYQ